MRLSTMIGFLTLCVLLLVGHESSEEVFWTETKPVSFEEYSHKKIRPISPDSMLFAAVAKWAQEEPGNASAEAIRFHLHVDPRPLRSDIEGVVLRERSFAEGDASVMENRRAVLQHLDIPQRNALAYQDECLFACDPRLVKQEEVDRVECPREECMTTVVAVSLPVHTDTNTDQEVNDSEQAKTAVQVLRLTPFSASIYELVFQQEEGTYTIVEQKRVVGGAM